MPGDTLLWTSFGLSALLVAALLGLELLFHHPKPGIRSSNEVVPPPSPPSKVPFVVTLWVSLFLYWYQFRGLERVPGAVISVLAFSGGSTIVTYASWLFSRRGWLPLLCLIVPCYAALSVVTQVTTAFVLCTLLQLTPALVAATRLFDFSRKSPIGGQG